LDWRAKVELFEEIRREYEFGIGTIAGVAKKLTVHRRMVREAIGSALPTPRKKTERPRWKLAGAVAFVDGILELDRKAPQKQRHTARRIWERMRAEMQECSVCERTVRQYVRERKTVLGLVVNEVFVPQSYDWGVEAQVDWYEAAKRRRCSSHSGRIGASTASSAHLLKGMRRVAWKEKPATSAGITGCRCRRWSIWRN
jgi:hypothetical protein